MDPVAVLEWDAEIVEDAIQIMGAESRYAKREQMKRDAEAKRRG